MGIIRFESQQDRIDYSKNIGIEIKSAKRRHDNKKNKEESPPQEINNQVNIDNIDIKIPDFNRVIPSDFCASKPKVFDKKRIDKFLKEEACELKHSERELKIFHAEGPRKSAETNRLVNIGKSPTQRVSA